MDPTVWIATITAVANMITAWRQSKTAGIELEQARVQVNAAQVDGTFHVSNDEEDKVRDMRISPPVLEALVEDIKKAEERFVKAIKDPTYTPAQLDQEEEIARAVICKHIVRIKELNCSSLPAADLQRISDSYGCEAG